MAGFVTDQQVLNYLAAELHRSGAAVASDVTQSTFWPPIATQANLSAYNEIFDRLIRRGWTPGQIALWDRGVEVQLEIAAYKAIERGGLLDQVQTALLDRLKGYFDPEVKTNLLDNTLLTINGQWQTPGDTPGTVGTGPLDTSQDMFVMPTQQDDPRIGDVVRW